MHFNLYIFMFYNVGHPTCKMGADFVFALVAATAGFAKSMSTSRSGSVSLII